MCTSFVNFHDKPLYGMNMACYDTPVRLKIREGETGIKTFYVDLWVRNRFADRYGGAVIVETINNQNDITYINAQAMTGSGLPMSILRKKRIISP